VFCFYQSKSTTQYEAVFRILTRGLLQSQSMKRPHTIQRITNMKKIIPVVMLTVLCLHGACLGDIVVDVYASSAPNAAGAASWGAYVTNAMYAIENGLSVYGDPSTSPSAYTQAPDVIGPGDIAVTSFHTWKGVINPPAPFANEYGNRLHFGLHILGNGTQFSISQLSFAMDSSDATDSLACSYATGSYNYSSSYVGINYGTDGIKGTSDDVRITSGANTQLVDELVSRGSGNGWWPGGDLPDAGVGDPQSAMDTYLAWLGSEAPVTVTGTYALAGGPSGSDSVVVTPEPASLVLLCVAALCLLVCNRRRRPS
jgi:hypothetical protein